MLESIHSRNYYLLSYESLFCNLSCRIIMNFLLFFQFPPIPLLSGSFGFKEFGDGEFA